VYSQVTPPTLACCMISQQIQGVWSGAVCNQAKLTDWQNVIPYGGMKTDNAVIIN